jgi:hypothetical protein
MVGLELELWKEEPEPERKAESRYPRTGHSPSPPPLALAKGRIRECGIYLAWGEPGEREEREAMAMRREKRNGNRKRVHGRVDSRYRGACVACVLCVCCVILTLITSLRLPCLHCRSIVSHRLKVCTADGNVAVVLFCRLSVNYT